MFEFERKISRKKQVYFVYWRTIGREMVCLRSTIRSVCGVKARKASFRRKVDRRVAKEGPSKRVKKDLSRVAIRPYLRLLEGYDPSLCPPYHRARIYGPVYRVVGNTWFADCAQGWPRGADNRMGQTCGGRRRFPRGVGINPPEN